MGKVPCNYGTFCKLVTKSRPMKRFLYVLIFMTMASCGEMQEIINQLPQGGTGITDADIAAALRQALNEGIERQVSSLMKEGGFYNQPDVRILLPAELQDVDKALRQIGLGNLADEGIRMLKPKRPSKKPSPFS